MSVPVCARSWRMPVDRWTRPGQDVREERRGEERSAHLVEAGAVERAAHEDVAGIEAKDFCELEAHLCHKLGG